MSSSLVVASWAGASPITSPGRACGASSWWTGAAGARSAAPGGSGAEVAAEVNVRLSLLSRDKLLAFQDETGVDPGYRPVGYLFLAATEAQKRQLGAALEVQRACGCADAAQVDVEDVRRLAPCI